MSLDQASVTRYPAASRGDEDTVVITDGPLRAVSRVEPTLHQACVELTGELDIGGAQVAELVLRRAERSAMPIVLLDLSALHFIDVTGLRTVLAAEERTRRRGQRLVLLRPPPGTFTVFALTGADELLTFLD
jgi:anti-anti-sigma factor